MEGETVTEPWNQIAERRIGALETHCAVEEVHRLSVEARLAAIEDTLKWLVRLIVGAFVTTLMGIAFSGMFIVGT